MHDETPKKPNIILRLLALLITVALVLGALVLVVYRDKLNITALERWVTARQIETDQSGQPTPFTYAGGDMLSAAFLDKGILFAGEAGAHYYAPSGQLYAEQVVEMESPVLSACAKSGVADSRSNTGKGSVDGENRTFRPVSKYIKVDAIFGFVKNSATVRSMPEPISRSSSAQRINAAPRRRLRP